MLAHRYGAFGTAPCNSAALLRRSPAPLVAPLRSRQSQGLSTCRAQKVSELPTSLKNIVGLFQMVPDPMARYKQLLFYATKLAPLPAEDHTPANKVEGCVSQARARGGARAVWVVPELREDGKVYWRADSDSALTKGLAALLVTGLSGCTPAEILSVQPDFIEALGLKQSLTPSRNNGFLNMFRLMQRKTLEAVAASMRAEEAEEAAQAPSASVAASNGTHHTNGDGNGAASSSPTTTTTAATSSAPSTSAPSTPAPAAAAPPPEEPASATPLQDGMRRKLTEALRPAALTILDESSQHAGHAAMMIHGKAGGTAETHFKVEVVAETFEGMTQVKRQRMIYKLLEEEFAKGLHALALVTRTPAEAAKVGSAV
ncbi:SufE-like protein, chloroplastic [Tetrabaena socialis]|uniref:SufE-like protein, chloroplastic n=1 Tax=Tetrabaena socialis TaxID=47790 RepID=A0A2J8AD25_9CHLO|nr:SufE-like protein, chloroplastic [Tetrabaena socialis]|eukprot:PNH10424.1 SufE-like protein, chloroplastic [Tetrabaena socialis]